MCCSLHSAVSVWSPLPTPAASVTPVVSGLIMQVKSKCRDVQLHKDSPLGEAVLECYATGNRNVFSLGFVPVAGDNTVVLLARDTPANSPAVRDLGVDMSQVQDTCREGSSSSIGQAECQEGASLADACARHFTPSTLSCPWSLSMG